MAGELHHRHLHPQADAEIGNLILAGPTDGGDHPLDSPVPKTAGHDDPSAPSQQFRGIAVVDVLGVHPTDIHLHPVFDPTVGQRLHHGDIGVVEGHIFPHQGDLQPARRAFGSLHHGTPLLQVGLTDGKSQYLAHRFCQPGLLQHQRHFVEDGGGLVGDDPLRRHIAEQGDLVPHLLGHRPVAAAEDHIRLDAQAQQLLYRMLGGLALGLPGAGNGDDEGDMEVKHILPPHLSGHLTDGLQEGLGLDVSHRAADLGDDHVHLLPAANPVDALLDLTGDVWDDLDRAPQEGPLTLPAEDGPVDLSGGDGGVHRQIFVGEPLVMAQVQVGLRPVLGNEHLPVLIGVHSARVNVQVGVELLEGHLQPPGLQ